MGSYLRLAIPFCVMLFLASSVLGQTTITITTSRPSSRPEPEVIKETPPKPDPELDKVTPEARDFYNKVLDLYMGNKFSDLKDAFVGQAKLIAALTPTLRNNVNYMKSSSVDFRPPWWKSCRNSSNISFQAKIWDRQFTANYVPSEDLGEQMPLDYNEKTQRFTVIVSWRPNYIDNGKPLKGAQAVRHKLSQGDLGEVIIWHELGHNYITNFIPGKQVTQLYRDYHFLFDSAQEFYADMTALYHCTPHGRMTCLCMRTEDIESGQESGMESHHRAAYAIGAILLSNFLQEPAKWPSVHFPGAVPAENAEINTIIYMYDHFAASLTLAEDRALRDLVHKFIFTNGDTVLRNKGEFLLANKFKFNIVGNDDRELVGKRDVWVKTQLKKVIDSGQADNPPKNSTSKPSGDDDSPFRRWWHPSRIEIPW